MRNLPAATATSAVATKSQELDQQREGASLAQMTAERQKPVLKIVMPPSTLLAPHLPICCARPQAGGRFALPSSTLHAACTGAAGGPGGCPSPDVASTPVNDTPTGRGAASPVRTALEPKTNAFPGCATCDACSAGVCEVGGGFCPNTNAPTPLPVLRTVAASTEGGGASILPTTRITPPCGCCGWGRCC